MIVVDSSVWVDFFNGVESPQVESLNALFADRLILVGDLILCEVLQGFRREQDFEIAERAFERFDQAAMAGPAIARQAAANYRALRREGITVRKTIDLLIGTFCIENGHALLHADRDYDPMAERLGLSVV